MVDTFNVWVFDVSEFPKCSPTMGRKILFAWYLLQMEVANTEIYGGKLIGQIFPRLSWN